MATKKQLNTRIIQKHDTSENWNKAINFTPLLGEIIIYDDLKKIKIGDGETSVNNLSFFNAGTKNLLDGKANGSLRTINSTPEDEAYSLGMNAFAEGNSTKASGNDSHAEGDSTEASGNESHAEGYGTKASGDYSHAEGAYTEASGEASHAEGLYTETSGNDSHAEGAYTEASGGVSHAEGFVTTASGEASHAEGRNTIASRNYSHTEGYWTKASSESQHVQGKYNIEDASNKYAHIVGNGTYQAPSNAHTLDWQGNAWYQGDVLVGGTNQDDPKAISLKKIAQMQLKGIYNADTQTLSLSIGF